jgi:hypothetical protein
VSRGWRLRARPYPRQETTKGADPRLVELACAWLGEHKGQNRALTPAERATLWRDFLADLPMVDHVIDDSRDALYDPPRGL